ncbi:MAG: AAA family ATPase, partial [Actinomycetota bacterium]|nr:AAA family ATPase [Actinomycetota bacterium]
MALQRGELTFRVALAASRVETRREHQLGDDCDYFVGGVQKQSPLVGRAVERAALAAALQRCQVGEGGLMLVHGDAGVGKSRLVSEVLGDWEGCVLRGAVGVGEGAYAPVVEVLRAVSDAFGDAALAEHARVLLPELAMPWREVDHGALVAAIHRTLRDVARRHPTVVVLEDLHWANAATIELLPMLAAALSKERLLIVGTYRSEELARSHPLRAMRSELRRGGRLVEVGLGPLTQGQTGEMLAGLFAIPPSTDLVAAVHERAEGLPFFIEELAAALVETGALATRDGIVELASGTELPLSESLLDAVLVATARLRREHQLAVELAAVFGVRIDLPSFSDLVSPEDVDALLDAGLLVEESSDSAVFRHALVRDALYRAIPWARRRGHHRLVAEQLATRRTAPEVVAEHWIAGHDPARARPLLLAAAEQFCSVHAYRDAAALGRRALSIWPEGEGESERLGVLERLADCSELCGELEEAASVWAELAELRRSRDEHVLAGLAFRRLAN